VAIDDTGDIQDKADVSPDALNKYELIKELVGSRGRTHVYYANHRDEGTGGAHDDIHLNEDNTHFLDDQGWVFVQHGDVQRWLFPEAVLFVENHYD